MMLERETPLSRSLSMTPKPESSALRSSVYPVRPSPIQSYQEFLEQNDPYYPGKNVTCELFEIQFEVDQNTDPEMLIKSFEQLFRTDDYVKRMVISHYGYTKLLSITVIEKGKGISKWTDYKIVDRVSHEKYVR
jgi:hypothetical protein